MKTLRLQRDPDGLFLWHPDYAPWIVGRHSGGANPNDRAFFDPKAGEIVWSNRDGMKDYEMEELAARHLVGELVEMPQFESEREVEDWFLERVPGRMDLSSIVEPPSRSRAPTSRVGHLLVRKRCTLQSHEDAQSTLKPLT